MLKAKFQRLIRRFRDYMNVTEVRHANIKLTQETRLKGYEIQRLEAALYRLQESHAIVRREALLAEQVITGIKSHLDSHPQGADRVVRNMLSAR